MRKLITFIMGFILCPAFAMASVPKTAGDYEIMMDALNSRGGVSTAGDMSLYSSIGQSADNNALTSTTYSLVNGFMGVIDELPPSVDLTNPIAFSTQSGTFDVIGTAYDRTDTQWTIYLAPTDNSDPDFLESLTSGSGNVAGHTFAQVDTTDYSGAYSVYIVAVDGRGNTATGSVAINIDHSITISGNIPKLEWIFMGMSAQPDPADPLTIFGASNDFKIFRWDPELEETQELKKYYSPESLAPGDGFWIRAFNSDIDYSYNAHPTETTADYTISIKPGWNQISSPYDEDYIWGNVAVESGGTTYSMEEAGSAGIINSTFWNYDNDAASGTESWVPRGEFDIMESGVGCLVYAWESADLIFDINKAASRPMARIVRPVEDYKINISARTDDTADLYNFIGSAGRSAVEFDPGDSPEPLATLHSRYTSVYFPRENWSKHPGNYSADIRPLARRTGDRQEWTMKVETTEAGKLVTLSWDSSAIPSDRFSFTLVNISNGDRVDMSAQSSYSYIAPAGGVSETDFRIEVVKLYNEEGQVTLTKTLEPGWSLISVPLEPEITSALEQLGDDLPLLDVFQFFDGKFYPAESADIQAGIGYWVHVADNTEIDIQGVPVAAQISVPLRKGWNLVGNPYETSLAWSDNITFSCSGQTYTLSQAVDEGITSGKIYEYDGDSYSAAEQMSPWKGYFLKAYSQCDLIIGR